MHISIGHIAKSVVLVAFLLISSVFPLSLPAATAAGNTMMPVPRIKSPALKAPSVKPPTKSPTGRRRSVRKSTRRQDLHSEKGNATVKTDENRNKRPVERLKNVSAGEDEPAETVEFEAIDGDSTPDPEGNKVLSPFPHSATAKLIEDRTFRMMVTMDGTKFKLENDDLMKLESGSVLVSPSHKIKVTTPSCVVELQEGSVVSIDSTEDTTYVRDFHDRWKGHVVVHINSKEINLMPGTELIVTSETDPDKAWQNAVRHRICRRDLAKYQTDVEKLTVFRGDFSIPDAMLKSHLFLYLKEHQDAHARAILDDITKTAALLQITDHGGPYTLLK
jgi:hypothetical protein